MASRQTRVRVRAHTGRKLGAVISYFLLFFFSTFLFYFSHSRRSTRESRENACDDDVELVSSAVVVCFRFISFLFVRLRHIHGGNGHRLAKDRLIWLIATAFVWWVFAQCEWQSQPNEMAVCHASEWGECVCVPLETSDEITWIRTSELKQKLLRMYAYRCVRLCVWISWRWCALVGPAFGARASSVCEGMAFCIRSPFIQCNERIWCTAAVDAEILNELPNFGSCNIQFSGKWTHMSTNSTLPTHSGPLQPLMCDFHVDTIEPRLWFWVARRCDCLMSSPQSAGDFAFFHSHKMALHDAQSIPLLNRFHAKRQYAFQFSNFYWIGQLEATAGACWRAQWRRSLAISWEKLQNLHILRIHLVCLLTFN